MSEAADRASAAVRNALTDLGLVWAEPKPGLFSVSLPGTRKLITECALEVGAHALQDRVLGAVADTADDSFNVILELGFAESIRQEWVWRRSRGESTANLAAFSHLDPDSGHH